MPLLLLLVCLWANGSQAVSAQPGRNPFVPASAASAPAKEKPPAPTLAPPAAAGLPKLPSTLPGPYRPAAPLIPPPPPGLALPTLQLQTPDQSPPPAGEPSKEPAQDPKAERKPDVFLSREQLAAERAKCAVTLKSPSTVTFNEAGGRQTVKLSVVGGRQCVKGVASSEDWVEVSSVSDNGELVLVVHENDSTDERSAEVNIANTGTSLTVRVLQSASKEEFRQLKL